MCQQLFPFLWTKIHTWQGTWYEALQSNTNGPTVMAQGAKPANNQALMCQETPFCSVWIEWSHLECSTCHEMLKKTSSSNPSYPQVQ